MLNPSAASGDHARPTALLIANDAAALARTICGTTVFARLACALDRAADGLFVLAPPSFPAATSAAARAEVEARPTPVRGQWQARVDRIGVDHGLIVAIAAVVVDHRIVTAATQGSDRDHLIAAFQRPNDVKPGLWFLGREAARGLLAALDGAADAGAAAEQFLAAQTVTRIDPGAELCELVTARSDLAAIEAKLFRLGRKASDTVVARVFDRTISLFVTRRLIHRPITPNHITVGATAIGVLGGLLLADGGYGSQLLGALLLTLSIIVDGCDGEVARIKYMESDFGRRLDFFLDNVVNILAIFAVGAGHYWNGGPFFYFWASCLNAAAAAGSVFPVYWLFFRRNKESVRLGGTDATAPPRPSGLLAVVEDLSGRDFAYLILALAVIGKAYWFTYFALFGLTAFFFVALVALAMRLAEPGN